MSEYTKLRHDHPNGHEILDPKPLQPPLGYRRAPSLSEQIRTQVLAAKLADLEALEETEDEADDFEIGDDFEHSSPHENDGAPSIKQLRAHAEKLNREIQRQNTEKIKKQLEKRQQELRDREYGYRDRDRSPQGRDPSGLGSREPGPQGSPE